MMVGKGINTMGKYIEGPRRKVTLWDYLNLEYLPWVLYPERRLNKEMHFLEKGKKFQKRGFLSVQFSVFKLGGFQKGRG